MAGNINTYMFDVTIVSPRNYFLFTPGLPDVTVGTTTSERYVLIFEPLSNEIQPPTWKISLPIYSWTESFIFSVTEPIRNFAQRNKKVLNYYEASASDIDINKKAVTCKSMKYRSIIIYRIIFTYFSSCWWQGCHGQLRQACHCRWFSAEHLRTERHWKELPVLAWSARYVLSGRFDRSTTLMCRSSDRLEEH